MSASTFEESCFPSGAWASPRSVCGKYFLGVSIWRHYGKWPCYQQLAATRPSVPIKTLPDVTPFLSDRAIKWCSEWQLTAAISGFIDTDATSAMKVRAARTIVEEMTEGSTVLHHYQPKAARINWLRRVFAWIRRAALGW